MSHGSEQAPTDFQQAWQDLQEGRIEKFRAGPPSNVPVKIVFPGAFNPLHEGHLKMAALASQRLGASVDFEISIKNVDKPPLEKREVARRLHQFAPQQRVWITRAPTFVRKANLFPGVTFLVGVDTLQRIALARYYGDDAQAAGRAIQQIVDCGCRFLVFGRLLDDGFCEGEDLRLPTALGEICTSIPSADFRVDISSTDLRNMAQK